METFPDPIPIKKWAWLLIFAGLLMQLSFIFVKQEALAHRPFEEDTFFHMAVTRNMAMGKGITIDGKEPSSGAQPGNFVYALAHLAGGFDKWRALRWARLLDIVGSAAGAACLYGIVRRLARHEDASRRNALGLFTAGLWLSSFQVFRVNLNGYETGFAAAVLLGASLIYLVIWQREADRPCGFAWDLLLGLVFGVAVLVRVDHGFLALSGATCFLWLGPGGIGMRFRRVCSWGTVAFLVTLPWWIFNLQVGGSVMPISGKASAFQMTFHGFWPSIEQCFIRTVESLAGIFTLSFYSPYDWGDRWWWNLLQLGGITLLAVAGLRLPPARALRLQKIELRPLTFLLVFSLILTAYYSFAHGSWWFMKRYTHPIRAAAYIFSGYFCCYLAVLGGRLLGGRSRLAFHLLMTGFLGISVASVWSTYNQTNSNQFMPVMHYLQAHCRDGRIGAFQSGTLGYFLDNVVNLDGKNNTKALHAVVSKQVIPYMLSQNLKYIADWPEQIGRYCDFQQFSQYYKPIARVNSHEIYVRREPGE